jgi:ABC-2 type transport system permease protein
VSVGVVARADLRQTGRSWRLPGSVVAFAFFFAGAAAIFVSLGRLPGVVSGSAGFPGALVSPSRLLFPLTGILVGYQAVVGERASGRLKLLLALPNARFEVVFGKLLSRVALLSATATVGAAVGYVSLVLFGGSTGLVDYATVVALALLLQATFVAVSVGLSAGIGSETVVAAVALGLGILCTTLWQPVVGVLADALSALGIDATGSVTAFVTALNPVFAFSRLASLAVGTANPAGTVWREWWVAVLVLLWWCLVPTLVGVWRFERAQL